MVRCVTKNIPDMHVFTQGLVTMVHISDTMIKPHLHYMQRDATRRDVTRRDMTRHSSIVHTMRDIVARRHVAAGDLGSGANKIR